MLDEADVAERWRDDVTDDPVKNVSLHLILNEASFTRAMRALGI